MFWAYAKHEQEKEKLINQIINMYHQGIMDFNIQLDDNFSKRELEEIQKEVIKRIGVS